MTVGYDVMIVGCGPVGMVLAALLANEGVWVLALEREAGIGHRPRARHLDAEAMRVLQTIGVAEASEQLMIPVRGFRLANAEGHTLLEQPIDSTHPGDQGWLLDYQIFQPLLLQLLSDHLNASGHAAIRTNCEVTSLEQRDDEVRLSVTDHAAGTTEVLSSRYVVGCDGADSWVRKTIGSRFEKLGPDHPFLVIDGMPLRPDFRLPEHPVSVNVCDPRRPRYVSPGSDLVPLRVEFMVMPGEEPADLLTPESIARLTEPYFGDGDVRIDRAGVYEFHSLLVDQWRAGRVLLAGDAVHVQPPFMGQGLCSGVRDAANLAWKLAMVCRGDAEEGLLDTYQAERAPHARDWINEANRVGAIVMTTDVEAAARRDERLLKGDTKELRPITPTLGAGLHGTDSPPAGTLAPQPLLADGRRLDDLVGSRFVLAVAADLWRKAAPALRAAIEQTPHVVLLGDPDAQSALLARYDAQTVVVRPDRYVLGVANNAEELERVLRRIPSLGSSALAHGATQP